MMATIFGHEGESHIRIFGFLSSGVSICFYNGLSTFICMEQTGQESRAL